MNIKQTFIELTRHTYPHGQEHGLFDILPQNLEMDDFGNLYIKIGESDTMFTSHLDTATTANVPVNHVFDGKFIKTDGKSILGSDDKAGVTIMLYMIEKNIPGLYYFFLGEEVGCQGSKKLAAQHKESPLPFIKKVISFDKRGTESVVTFQRSYRCASLKFASELANQLNKFGGSDFSYKPDPKAFSTDSYQFIDIYPECTNISVGYYNEHTFNEYQDIEHLEKLAESCVKIDWSSLPVERDPSEREYLYKPDSYKYKGSLNNFLDEDESPSYSKRTEHFYREQINGEYYHNYLEKFLNSELTRDEWYFVEEQYKQSRRFSFSDGYFYLKHGKYTEVQISDKRILDEEDMIIDFLSQIEIEYTLLKWDAVNLCLKLLDGAYIIVNRQELQEYLEELNLTKVE